jgi:uncharacterized membrane protein YozB (DUF420 family)
MDTVLCSELQIFPGMSPDINILVQIGILIVLYVAVFSARRLKFDAHGAFILTIVAFNLASIVRVMLPSAIRLLAGASPGGFTAFVAAHSLVGVAVEAVGAYIVVDWAYRRTTGGCSKFAPWMRRLAPLWVLVTMSGAYMYYLLYL